MSTSNVIPLGNAGGDTPIQIRDKLETLTVDDRLNMTAVKTLQGDPAYLGAGWRTIATFTEPVITNNFFMRGRISLRDTSGARRTTFMFSVTGNFNSLEGAGNTSIESLNTVGAPVLDGFRLLRVANVLHLQVNITGALQIRSRLRVEFMPDWISTVDFTQSIWTDDPSQVVVTECPEIGVIDADIFNMYHSDGILAPRIGDVTGNGTWINFSDESTEIRHLTSKIMEAKRQGVLISGSSGSTFSSPKDFYTTNAIAPLAVADTEFGAMSVAVTNNGMTWSADLQNSYSGAAVPGFASQTNTQSMQFELTTNVDVLRLENVTGQVEMDLVTGSAGGNFNVTDSAGTVIRTGAIPVPTNKGEFFRILIDLPENGIINLARIGSNFIGIIAAQFNLVQAEVDTQDHLVLDLQSNSRALGLPKPIDTGNTPFQDGNLRNHPTENRPQTYQNGSWNYLNSSRFDVKTSEHTAFYYADSGNGEPLDQGWLTPAAHDGSGIIIAPVQGQYGYPALLHIVDATSNSPVGIEHLLDTTAEAAMFTNGFRWDFGARVDAGDTFAYIQVTSAYSGTAGRWIFSMNRSGTDTTITFTGGGSVTVTGDAITNVSLVVPAGQTTGKLYVDGTYAFDVPYAALTITQGKVLHTSGSSGSLDEDFWIRDSTFFALASTTKVFTREDIESNIRYHVPTVENQMTLTIPKGTYGIGTAFTVVNGASQPALVQTVADDSQLFSGKPTFDVMPYKEVTFTQTSFPRGNNWAIEGGKYATEHSGGNTLQLTVNAAGVLQSRHGNYLGGITVTRVAAGVYTIVPTEAAGHIFSLANTYISSSAIFTGGGYTAHPEFVAGEPSINTQNSANVDTDSDFSVSLTW